MDTSEEYIKMCEKAEEIQKEWKPHWGDFSSEKEDNTYVFVLTTVKNIVQDQQDYIWLPRQDQLQEMIIASPFDCDLWDRFTDFIFTPYNDDDPNKNEACELFQSGEQLWLAFVMEEKYNKVWDGTNWIEIGK